jgi:hypothetical protein
VALPHANTLLFQGKISSYSVFPKRLLEERHGLDDAEEDE